MSTVVTIGRCYPVLGRAPDLLLAWALMAAVTAPAGAQTVRGVLLESGPDSPIEGGIVTLLDTALTVVAQDLSDADGRFKLTAPRPGRYLIRAEQYGYRTKTDGVLELGPDGSLDLTFYLVPEPIALPGITAEVERALGPAVGRWLEHQGFFHRQKYLIGQFITPEDIVREPPMDWSQLFQKQAGIWARNGSTGDEVCIGMMGGDCCAPVVYVNGIRTFGLSTIHEEHVAAVEIYRGAARVPIEYAGMTFGDDLGSARCGVLLLWTKM